MITQENVVEELRLAVVNFDEHAVEVAARKAKEVGLDPLKAIEEGLAKGLREIGDKFERLEVYLSDMMLAAIVMNKGLEILKKDVPKESWKGTKGTVVIGTVKGDIHDIGKNLVSLLLMVNGFEVHDIGIDVSPERFVEKAKEFDADVIGLSALLSTTMNVQSEVISLLKDLKLRNKYKVIVGGAAITQEWANRIGADSYGKDSTDAVRKVTELLKLKEKSEPA